MRRSRRNGQLRRTSSSLRRSHGAMTSSGDGPFLRTGDLAFLHDGEVVICGRANDMIVMHGRNLYPQDIELAMTRGVNYPKGLLAWGDERGLDWVLDRMTALQAEYGEDRYRPSPLLRRMVADERRFTE